MSAPTPLAPVHAGVSTAGTERWRRLRTPLALGAGVGAAGALLLVRSPHGAGSYGFCPILEVTGLFCPGCGALRAVHDLLTLDLAGAFSMNPLLVVMAPLLVVLWGRWVWRAWRGAPTPLVSLRAIVVLGAVLVAFTVARNLPGLEPWLAP